MRSKVSTVCVFLAALVVAIAAQSAVDGSWAGQLPAGRGPMQVTFTLKGEGEKLTGSLVTGRGNIPLQDGTIKGNELAFKMTAGRGGQTSWTGTLKGDEITLKQEGQTQETVLKRQK